MLAKGNASKRKVILMSGVAAVMALGVAPGSSAVVPEAPAEPATAGQFATDDVRAMMAYSLKLAKKVNFQRTYKVRKSWKMQGMKFFEADGCPAAKDNPQMGCSGAEATTAGGFRKWVVSIAVVWKLPDKSLVAHTYSASFKNGAYTKSRYRKDELLEDHVFKLPKQNMVWAFAKEREWQLANPDVLPADAFPVVANVRAPLTPTLDDPTMWIFTMKTDSGEAYVGVDDKTGEVELLD
mgnify:FL=1|jgi:hypothetical protein